MHTRPSWTQNFATRDFSTDSTQTPKLRADRQTKSENHETLVRDQLRGPPNLPPPALVLYHKRKEKTESQSKNEATAACHCCCSLPCVHRGFHRQLIAAWIGSKTCINPRLPSSKENCMCRARNTRCIRCSHGCGDLARGKGLAIWTGSFFFLPGTETPSGLRKKQRVAENPQGKVHSTLLTVLVMLRIAFGRAFFFVPMDCFFFEGGSASNCPGTWLGGDCFTQQWPE
jgi:hypothetical protein